MKMFKPTKISHRLTIVYATLFFLSLALVNLATLFGVVYYMYQISTEQLKLVDDFIISDVNSLHDIPKIDLGKLSQIADNVDVSLNYNDRLVYNTGEVYQIDNLENKVNKTSLMGESNESRIMYLKDELILDDGTKLDVLIVKDMNNEEGFIKAFTAIMLAIDGLVFVFAIWVGHIISRKALLPIDKIISQAKEIGVGDLTARIRIEGPEDELKRLSDTFNNYIERTQLAYEKQNRFTLDASHELATPLAVIKGYIDILDRWGKNDPEVLDESLKSIKVEINNMTSLLDTLLVLSKADNEILNIEKSEIILEKLMKELVKETALIDDEHQIECDFLPNIEILGDQKLIKQMLRAIVNNSIRYSPAQTLIKIDYKVVGENVEIVISDQGIGISDNDIPYIFDRFYRVDKARTRSVGGTGLGLSLVKWIVEIHNGSIMANSEVGKGTSMVIRLPMNP